MFKLIPYALAVSQQKTCLTYNTIVFQEYETLIDFFSCRACLNLPLSQRISIDGETYWLSLARKVIFRFWGAMAGF